MAQRTTTTLQERGLSSETFIKRKRCGGGVARAKTRLQWIDKAIHGKMTVELMFYMPFKDLAASR